MSQESIDLIEASSTKEQRDFVWRLEIYDYLTGPQKLRIFNHQFNAGWELSQYELVRETQELPSDGDLTRIEKRISSIADELRIRLHKPPKRTIPIAQTTTGPKANETVHSTAVPPVTIAPFPALEREQNYEHATHSLNEQENAPAATIPYPPHRPARATTPDEIVLASDGDPHPFFAPVYTPAGRKQAMEALPQTSAGLFDHMDSAEGGEGMASRHYRGGGGGTGFGSNDRGKWHRDGSRWSQDPSRAGMERRIVDIAKAVGVRPPPPPPPAGGPENDFSEM